MPISYKPYDQIDRNRWDDCVDNSLNSLIYARSQYLDNMADNWCGLVLNDYEAVMPLPWRKKYGIRYLYQPAFIQQGGIYAPYKLNKEIINQFLQSAYTRFRFAEIPLNYANLIDGVDHFSSERNNYVITLNNLADGIIPRNEKTGYTLRQSDKQHLNYEPSENIHEAIELYKSLYHKRLPFFTGKDFERFENLCREWSPEDVIIRKAVREDKEIMSIVLLLKHRNRLYNLVSSITPEGKKLLANYFLYNNLVKEFSGSDLLLDLEGSDVPGIALFYRQLSGQPQPYPFIKWNNLPPLLKILKP